MILIRKRSDYYDYLINVYGRDEKRVFNRREDVVSHEIYFDSIIKWKNINIFDLIICNRMYRVEQVSKEVWELHKFHTTNTDYSGRPRHYRESQIEGLSGFVYYLPYQDNDPDRIPISIRGTYHNVGSLKGFCPILNTFGIPAILPAYELYAEIDMYIGTMMSLKEQSKSYQDDKNKLLSKGFDDKISFRHRNK